MRTRKACGRLQRAARTHRAAASSSARCCPSTLLTAPAAPPAGHLPPAADRGWHAPEAAHRARRLRLRQRGQLRRATPRLAAARAAGQRPRPPPRPHSPAGQAPGPVPGHRPRQAAPATSARPEDYRIRARTVEPVFGQLKTCQKLTMMSRRGLTACESEWLLASAAPICASCTGTARSANPSTAHPGQPGLQDRQNPQSRAPYLRSKISDLCFTRLCATAIHDGV